MLTFLHISDTHISADPNYHLHSIPERVSRPNPGAEALLEAIQGLPFAFEFIVHTGDACADPTAEDCQCARELLGRFPAPLYILPGNHDSAPLMEDHLHDGERLHVMRDARVQVGEAQLLTLDTNGAGDPHSPTLSDNQIEWFADCLEESAGQTTVVACHHPLIKTGVPLIDDGMRVQNGEEIQRILQRHSSRIAAVFHGHIHQSMDTHCDGVLYVSCQSLGSNLAAYPGLGEFEVDELTPGGFNLVMVDDNRVFVRRYSLPALNP